MTWGTPSSTLAQVQREERATHWLAWVFLFMAPPAAIWLSQPRTWLAVMASKSGSPSVRR